MPANTIPAESGSTALGTRYRRHGGNRTQRAAWAMQRNPGPARVAGGSSETRARRGEAQRNRTQRATGAVQRNPDSTCGAGAQRNPGPTRGPDATEPRLGADATEPRSGARCRCNGTHARRAARQAQRDWAVLLESRRKALTVGSRPW
ncbi:hypothetical protein GCM10022222_53600 [Amycolatopsis ultiminotia]|uniref:Uncharacterized protein n=1 Tax=Amycolatopsis ultiminotia TaxID=543629 RepID=A0ABP6X9D8_9PSEU